MSSIAQEKAVAIAPKFTAFASFIGSSLIAFLILFRRDGKSKTSYHRLVLGMAFTDISASAAWFFTTWPIPKGTPGVYGAVGNQQTCSAQAFFAQFSLSTVMYNASLAVYYVLVIVKGYKNKEVEKIEPLFHLNAILWGAGTAFASLGLTLFNQVGWDCWISAAPLGCKESWTLEPGEVTTCERGDNGSLYQWAFYYAPLWAVIVTVTVLMYWVYHSVRQQERKMDKYKNRRPSTGSNISQEDATTKKKREKLAYHKRIAWQAVYYVGAFLVAWFWPTVFQIVIVSANIFPWWLLFLTALFVPCQGLLNLIVFVRPRYMQYRQKNPEMIFIVAWVSMLKEELLGKPAESMQTSRVQTSYRNPNDSQLGNSKYPNDDDDGFDSANDEEKGENDEEEVVKAEGNQKLSANDEQKKQEGDKEDPDQIESLVQSSTSTFRGSVKALFGGKKDPDNVRASFNF